LSRRGGRSGTGIRLRIWSYILHKRPSHNSSQCCAMGASCQSTLTFAQRHNTHPRGISLSMPILTGRAWEDHSRTTIGSSLRRGHNTIRRSPQFPPDHRFPSIYKATGVLPAAENFPINSPASPALHHPCSRAFCSTNRQWGG
jgi:hypothetical protein